MCDGRFFVYSLKVSPLRRKHSISISIQWRRNWYAIVDAIDTYIHSCGIGVLARPTLYFQHRNSIWFFLRFWAFRFNVDFWNFRILTIQPYQIRATSMKHSLFRRIFHSFHYLICMFPIFSRRTFSSLNGVHIEEMNFNTLNENRKLNWKNRMQLNASDIWLNFVVAIAFSFSELKFTWLLKYFI